MKIITIKWHNISKYRIKGNKNLIIKLILDSEQYEYLLNYSKQFYKNHITSLTIKMRPGKEYSTIVLKLPNKVLSIGEILYPNIFKYWDVRKIFKKAPLNHPYLEKNTLILPDEEEIIYDYRKSNIYFPIDQQFFCAYHKNWTSLKYQDIDGRCISCNYLNGLLDEAKQISKKQQIPLKLDLNFQKDFQIDPNTINSNIYNPYPFESIFQYTPQSCFITGHPLKFNSGISGYKASLILKDSIKGYTQDNSILVSYAFSQMKKNFSLENCIQFIKRSFQNKIRIPNKNIPLNVKDLTKSQKKKLNDLRSICKRMDNNKSLNSDMDKITNQDILNLLSLQNYLCPIWKIPIEISYKSLNMISIDRKDHTLGHTMDNILITSHGGNSLRGNYFSLEEAQNFAWKAYNFLKDFQPDYPPYKGTKD